jgi:hypothetical protein
MAEDEALVFRAGTHTDTMSITYAEFEWLVEPSVAEFSDLPYRMRSLVQDTLYYHCAIDAYQR